MPETIDNRFNPAKFQAIGNVRRVMGVVKQAISETMPQAMEYQDLWVREVMLHSDPQKLQSQERLALPTAPLRIHNMLLASGFEQKFMDGLRLKASPTNPFFTNYEEGKFHTLDALAKGLSEASSDIQLRIGVMVGFYLIDSNFRSIAHQLSPQIQGDERSDYWRYMIRSTLVQFAQAERGRFKDKKAYRAFKGKVDDLFSEPGLKKSDGVIEAVGASVICHFPGQSRINPEIRLGGLFNEGVVRSLTLGAKVRFAALYLEEGGYQINPESQKELDGLTKVSAVQAQAERVQQVLDIDLADAYFFSTLPRLYNESDDPRINPFNYPEIVEERDWLRK